MQRLRQVPNTTFPDPLTSPLLRPIISTDNSDRPRALQETLLLLQWLHEHGFGPVGVCGFSMGGVHSMMAVAVEKKPTALVTFLAPHSADSVRHPASHSADSACSCRVSPFRHPRLALLQTSVVAE